MMENGTYDLILSDTAPLENGQYPGFGYREERHTHFVKYVDVPVLLRDGVTMYVDIFRPVTGQPSPTLIGWSPYGKHGFKSLKIMPDNDVEDEWVSEHVIWEGPDPSYWCPRGYVVVSPDPRGAWSSEGTLTFWTKQEAEDGYDVIEWIAEQPWSNSKVGMLGVSYLAIAQWLIASTRPPSLAAICPWEGFSDLYREAVYHGGIPEHHFWHWWQPKSRFSLSPAEDVLQMYEAHPLIDAYWRDKTFDLEAIQAPSLIVAGWGDHGLHTRGTLEAFKAISSKQKWLEIHGRKKWRHFYDPASVARQTAFFDHFLLGKDTGLEDWPRVSFEVREDNARWYVRTADGWPLENAKPTQLFLDGTSGTLRWNAPKETAETDYDSTDPASRLSFDIKFDRDVEIVGTMNLKLWVSATEGEEIDIFIAIQKLDCNGEEVGLRFFATFDNGPVALGWLRASHRALDESRSTPLQPVHKHTKREAVKPNEIIPLQIEIWPSATLFRRGESFLLVIAGTDLYRFDTGAPEMFHETENVGKHKVHTGGVHDSHLLVPII